MTEHLAEWVRRSLRDAPPSDLLEALAATLREAGAAGHTDLLLVDYRLASLLPVRSRAGGADAAGDDAPPGDLGPAWRCFDGQTPVTADGVVHLPVSVRGERLGVLRVTLPTPPEDGPASLGGPGPVGDITELAAVADVLANELAAVRPSTDRYLVAARARRLTLAAEMQWELLPGRSCATSRFSLAGQLEPAYAVRGDTFDWAVNADELAVTVLDGMGEGVSAALLSTMATCALRNARRAGVSLVDQASLADEALFAEYRGAQYVSAMLLSVDLRSGVLTTVDAGSPQLLLVRSGQITDLAVAAHDPLGMFEGTRYTATMHVLRPGDRLLLVSDGIHAASVANRSFGESDLYRFVRRSRTMSPLDVVRTLVNELRAFVAGDLADDAAVVCLDWYGSVTRGTTHPAALGE